MSKIVVRGLQSYWRFTRGAMLAADACLIDARNRVGLAKSGSGDGWLLPRTEVRNGEALEQALRRMLKDAHGIEFGRRPDLLWVYDENTTKPGLRVGLFVIRNWTTTALQSVAPGLTFFAVKALPPGLDARDAARICQAAEGRAPFEVC